MEDSKLTSLLDLDYSEQEKIGLTNQKTLRKLVGILGVFLPLLLFVTLWIARGNAAPLESISHYYYTRVAGIFVIIVSLMAIFCWYIKGESRSIFTSRPLQGYLPFACCCSRPAISIFLVS